MIIITIIIIIIIIIVVAVIIIFTNISFVIIIIILILISPRVMDLRTYRWDPERNQCGRAEETDSEGLNCH